MGTPLKIPPVYFTVVQARFNPLLKLSEYLPEVQETMRKAGFPDFKSVVGVGVQMEDAPDGSPVPKPIQFQQFHFANVPQTHSFVLANDALTFQSTDYGTFEQFSGAFISGLERVHEVVGLDFVSRIGLRYLDCVAPRVGEALEAYLAPEVHGLGAKLGGELLHSFAETLSAQGEIKLRSRVIVQDGPLGFPPDVSPSGLVVQSRFLEVKGRRAILDNDGFIDGRWVFLLKQVEKQVNDVHEVISAAFRVAATDHARAVWNS